MVTQEEAAQLVAVAQACIAQVVEQVRSSAWWMSSAAGLTTWQSQAAERFRDTARDIQISLEAAAYRCEDESAELAWWPTAIAPAER